VIPDQLLLFPPFRLDPINEQLWRGKREIALKPKTFAVLRYLAERSGQLVTKEEFLNTLWTDVYVGDAVLKVCVQEIRAALKDNAKAPRFIETVHRRGYRFLPPVTTTPPVQSPKSKVQSFQSAIPNPHSAMNLVGREAELTQLHQWLDKALNGERQVVFVTGEPGIGKTALMEAFLQSLESRVRSLESEDQKPPLPPGPTLDPRRQTLDLGLLIARGQCLEQYGVGEAYLPVLEALGHLCQGPGRERVVGVLNQYTPTWLVQMPALLSAGELKQVRRRVEGVTKERMLREIAEAVEALTRERGLVLCLDDLQWSDYATLDFLSYMARRSHPARLLILGAYRPVDVIVAEHPLKTVKQDLLLHRQCEELAVELLDEDDIAVYLVRRFGEASLSKSSRQRLARMIYARTEGNPLFMVNVVDYLVGQRVIQQHNGQWEVNDAIETVEVPLNVRQFIEQQTDQLPAAFRQMLRAASTVGMEFSTAAVAAGLEKTPEEVEQSCAELAQRGQFLAAKGTSEWPDGTVAGHYGFLHALYQEVLYNRLTVRDRIKLHKRVGERLETAYGDRVKEIAAELAVHFEQGRDAQRTVQYLYQAGENAVQRGGHREAVTHLTRAVERLQTLPNTLERAQFELNLQLLLGTQLSTSKGFAAAEAERAYVRAKELCDQIGETPQRFAALGGLFTFSLTRAELQTALSLAEQLMELAQKTQFEVFFLWADLCLGRARHTLGDVTSAQKLLAHALTLYDPQKHRVPARQDPGVLSLSHSAQVLWLLGYPDQAVHQSQEALSLAREIAHPLSLAHALQSAARIHLGCGDLSATRKLADELIHFAQEQGFAVHEAGGMMLQGWVAARQGQDGEEIALMHHGLTLYQDTGTELHRPYWLALIAEAYGRHGQQGEGLKVVAEALTFVERTEERWYDAELYRLYGELSLQPENQKSKIKSQKLKTPNPKSQIPEPRSEAEACFLKAIDIAKHQQAKSLELRAVMSLVRLRQQQATQHGTRNTHHTARTRLAEAHSLLSEIYGWFTEGFDAVDLQDATRLLNECRSQYLS
jgi:DNA-binding winged helix-turn-helix (wHTH) protein/tetratricopeptide (TPR) repeat protein